MSDTHSSSTYELPNIGGNPSSKAEGTNPGSFALSPTIQAGPEGARTFASPDTPGMPAPSEKTAWDFMPEGWTKKTGFETDYHRAEAWQAPADFEPITQLESA
ncbi:MAG TPA: thiamine biosynthesis protein ThiC, partial [Planctomycetaceae bacterium]|nr:thiamine biosynthesis protein ThiC [Planctomycetaceae bacterium]